MKLRVIYFTFFLLAWAVTPAVASGAKLPGDALTVKEATARCQNVFVGQLVDLDSAKTGGAARHLSGHVIYLSRPSDGISISRTRQNTTGRVPAIPSRQGIAGTPVTMLLMGDENAPEVGREYVFYVRDNTTPGQTGYVALKLSQTGDRGLSTRY